MGMLLPERFRQGHGSLFSGYLGAPQVRPMGAGRDLFACRKDGGEFPVEIGLTPVGVGGENWILAAIVDISARKRAEHALREINARLGRQVEEHGLDLEHFFDVSLDMLCIAGTDGYFKRINPAFTTTLGYSKSTLLARPFLDLVHPEDVESTIAVMAGLKVGRSITRFENGYRSAARGVSMDRMERRRRRQR